MERILTTYEESLYRQVGSYTAECANRKQARQQRQPRCISFTSPSPRRHTICRRRGTLHYDSSSELPTTSWTVSNDCFRAREAFARRV
jgi:hypothetical protein